jgi:hypothetical protein
MSNQIGEQVRIELEKTKRKIIRDEVPLNHIRQIIRYLERDERKDYAVRSEESAPTTSTCR